MGGTHIDVTTLERSACVMWCVVWCVTCVMCLCVWCVMCVMCDAMCEVWFVTCDVLWCVMCEVMCCDDVIWCVHVCMCACVHVCDAMWCDVIWWDLMWWGAGGRRWGEVRWGEHGMQTKTRTHTSKIGVNYVKDMHNNSGAWRPPKTPGTPGGLAPRNPPTWIAPNMSPVWHDTCTKIIVHACTRIVVLIHARTMVMVYACIMIIVHASTMTIVHACTMFLVHVSCAEGLCSEKFRTRGLGGEASKKSRRRRQPVSGQLSICVQHLKVGFWYLRWTPWCRLRGVVEAKLNNLLKMWVISKRCLTHPKFINRSPDYISTRFLHQST